MQQAYNQVGQLCQIAPLAANCTAASSYYAANFLYNSPGNLTGFSYGNGVKGSFYYSPDRSQLEYLAYTRGTSTYFSLQYSYQKTSSYSPACPHGTVGNNGSIQCITDNVDIGRSVGYDYDQLERMNAAKTCGSSAFPQWGLSESYDRYGNRLNQTATAGSLPQPNFTFNVKNQPSGFAFDTSGNMTGGPNLSPMNYDGENRMTAYNGASVAGYSYDGNGLRVIKSVSGGTTTVSVFSGSSVIAEYDNGAAPTSPTREYVYGGMGLLAMFSGGTTTYYHQDNLSVRLTTDANGNVLTQQATFPFGEQWYQSGSGNKFVFTSYDRDSESGLDYAMARYYSSSTGTFIMADPVAGTPSDPQSWNRYPYGRNDPINITDPSGKSWWEKLLVGIGVAVSTYLLTPVIDDWWAGLVASAGGAGAKTATTRAAGNSPLGDNSSDSQDNSASSGQSQASYANSTFVLFSGPDGPNPVYNEGQKWFEITYYPATIINGKVVPVPTDPNTKLAAGMKKPLEITLWEKWDTSNLWDWLWYPCGWHFDATNRGTSTDQMTTGSLANVSQRWLINGKRVPVVMGTDPKSGSPILFWEVYVQRKTGSTTDPPKYHH